MTISIFYFTLNSQNNKSCDFSLHNSFCSFSLSQNIISAVKAKTMAYGLSYWALLRS